MPGAHLAQGSRCMMSTLARRGIHAAALPSAKTSFLNCPDLARHRPQLLVSRVALCGQCLPGLLSSPLFSSMTRLFPLVSLHCRLAVCALNTSSMPFAFAQSLTLLLSLTHPHCACSHVLSLSLSASLSSRHRVAALESMLEGGHDHVSLASLRSYRTLVVTCGTIFAEAAALCAALSGALQHKQRLLHSRGDIVTACRKLVAAAAGVCGHSRTGSSAAGSRGADVKLAAPAPAPVARQLNAAASSEYGSHSMTLPGVTTLDSSMLSDQLVSTGSGDVLGPYRWQESRQGLLAVLQFETGQYYQALASADERRPFRLDPARSMVSLMFLTTLCLGVVEASQKLQGAVDAVLNSGSGRKHPGSSTAGSSSSGWKAHASGPQPAAKSAFDIAHADTASSISTPQAPGSTPASSRVIEAATITTITAATMAPTTSSRSSSTDSPQAAGHQALWQRVWSTLTHLLRADNSSSSTRLLLEIFLMVDVARRIWEALFVQLPAACKSRAGKCLQRGGRPGGPGPSTRLVIAAKGLARHARGSAGHCWCSYLLLQVTGM